MPKLTYVAASAMQVESQALDIAARNLAHAQTTGYRKEVYLRGSFAEELKKQGKTGDLSGNGGAGVLPDQSYFIHRPGQHEQTGAPLDLALGGNGFFRVTAPDGRTLVTRAGHFQLDPQSRIVTPDGWPVQGQAGPITVPKDAERVVMDRTGRLTALVRTNNQLQEVVVDQLRLAHVERPEGMRAMNGQYFDPGDQPMTDATAEVRQGYLEKANLEPIQELAEMISIQRRYEAAQKALRETTNLGGNVSELLRGNA